MPFFSISKTLFGSLFSKPPTIALKDLNSHYAQRTRGHIENDIGACIFCGICQRKCPTGAIEVARKDGVWSIERLQCIQCDGCVEVCPTKCLHMIAELTPSSGEKTKYKAMADSATAGTVQAAGAAATGVATGA